MRDPDRPQKRAPIAVELVEGEMYYHCLCGKSAREPFCDGAHKGGPIGPTKFVAKATGPAKICACGLSGEMPYCDGSHNQI